MNAASLYDQISLPVLSLPAVALLLLVALPAAAVAGYFAGRRRRETLIANGQETEAIFGETTLGAIIGLLGLLLAFSFGNALQLSENRKSAIVEEAAVLGTAFLRADYLPEPGRSQLKNALLDYGKTRVIPDSERLTSKESMQAFIAASLEEQSKLWPLTLEVTADPVADSVKTFVAASVNDTIDQHLYRVKNLSNPVSDVTQGMMLALALTSLFILGNRSGSLGRRLTWRTFVLSGFLFVVMIAILDTLRWGEGFVQTDATALKVTVFEMEQGLGGRN